MEVETILAQYKEAVDKGSIFSKTDKSGRITYVNDRFCDITGYDKEELIGKTHSVIKHSDTPKSVFEEMWNDISSGKIWRGLIKNRKKDGSTYYVNSIIFPIKDANEKIIEYISMRQDITELIKSKKLVEIYSTDLLTNLPNEQKLNEKLKNNDKDLMLILLDIKEFYLVNELYGEEIGDDILVEVSSRLKSMITDTTTNLYRLHADAYAIVVEDEHLYDKYKSLIEYTLLSDESFIINDIVIYFNIGVAYGKENLLQRSNIALKEAKKRKSRLCTYDESIDAKDIHKKNLEKFINFKEALADDRIVPFFQPIVDAKTQKIVKYESLARIINEDGTILQVGEFLDIAQKSSFFENFMRQMIQKIFAVSKQSGKEVTVNLTFENISSKKFVDYIENRLKMHTGPKITFEILESDEIEDYTVLEDFIGMVKSYGALVAIDDFGTGYSNFIHLSKFDADFLKIDGSIVENVINDKNSELILSLLIEYAKKSNIKTIAEYVSDEKIALKMKEMGVDLLQGYYYGKPENAEFYEL